MTTVGVLIAAVQVGAVVKMVTDDPPKPEPKVSTLELTPSSVLKVWPVATPINPLVTQKAGNRPSTFVRSQKRVSSLEGDKWDALANCESERGRTSDNIFQFKQGTWEGTGRSGRPGDHSYEEQRQAAEEVATKYGFRSQFPGCSRKLGLR